MLDFIRRFKDRDNEPKPDIAVCAECRWRGPVGELETGIDYDWEMGDQEIHLCPVCEDGGCIDDYDMTEERAKEWEAWYVGKNG